MYVLIDDIFMLFIGIVQNDNTSIGSSYQYNTFTVEEIQLNNNIHQYHCHVINSIVYSLCLSNRLSLNIALDIHVEYNKEPK